MPSQVYFEGDFWYAVVNTAAGESPSTHPAKWRRMDLPAILVDPVSQAAYARLLAGDGQADKRIVEMRHAQAMLQEYIRRDRAQSENELRRATYDDYFTALSLLLGWNPEKASSNEWFLARRAINLALRQCWEAWWWGAVMQCEQLALRYGYHSLHTYTAGEQVYWDVANKYFVATKEITGPEPATVSGGVWTENKTAGWAELKSSYTATEYAAASAYTVGDRVSYANSVWQCVADVTGTAPPASASWYALPVFEYYLPAGMAGRPVIGGVRRIAVNDPLLVPDTDEFHWQQHRDGYRILGLTTTRPWVWYRVACPRLVGEAWSGVLEYDQESLLESVWGRDAEEPEEIEPQPGEDFDHYADRTDVTVDALVPTADYDETA